MTRICMLSSVHDALDNRVFYREARSLQQAGYDVTLIAVHDRNEVKDGVEIVGLPRVPRWRRPLLWLELLRRARATAADIYHFHDPELLFAVPWLRLLSGRPAIYDIHESYPDFIQVKDYLPAAARYPVSWLFRGLEPLLARLQSGLVFSDDQIAQAFASVDRPKATVHNYPSRAFVEEGVAATRAVESREPVVLYLGGMERNRGSGLMIEAFQQVHDEMPEARLLVVGHFAPPELEHEVRADVTRRGLEQCVNITGRVPFERIGEYLAQAVVGWVTWQPVPKNQKNVPTKVFEYMAYGLPIVCSDLPSARPFVADGKNGYLVRADDVADHARRILELLRNPAAASALGKRGQALVQTGFTWDVAERELLALYQELLS